MASTALVLVFGTYFCWAAMVSGKLFHQVWAAALLLLIFLTDKCLQQQSAICSVLYGTLWLLNIAVCIALSPVQVFLFKHKATYQATRPLDVFLPDPAPGSDSSYSISVDIIAVHGLGSSPEAAWAYRLDSPQDKAGNSTSTQNGTQSTVNSKYGPMWLKDFLPRNALQARVLVYYHNSGWQANALGMTLRDYGQDLLTSIESVRQSKAEQCRPVIFIGYSFGGLIVKQAMVIAHGASSRRLQSVFSPDCVKGFIFLGTPHLGSELTIFAKILSLLGYWQGASTALLEVIDPSSSENKSLHGDFLQRFGNREMVNFYEVQPEYVGPFPIMNAVKKDSAIMFEKDNIPSQGKHRAIHRFLSETDVGYTHLYQSIKRLVDNNVEKDTSDVSWITSLCASVETDFKNDLQRQQYDVQGMEWFLKSPEYTNWLSSHKSQFLWYSGLPGSGKTTTSLHVVQQIKQTHTSFRTRLAFFFCNRKRETRTVLASIISQLLDNDTNDCIPSHLRTSLSPSNHPTDESHETTLWEILEKILNNLLGGKERLEVRIIIDGLDELDAEDLSRFLRNLRELWDNIKRENDTEDSSRLKVLTVSRPILDISEIFKDLPFIYPEKESADCLNSLSLMAENQRRGIVSAGSEETGAWLWADDAYNHWTQATRSSLLWIQGKPGSGKSTLCKKILEHLHNHHDLPGAYATPDNAASDNISPQPSDIRSVVLASFFYSLRGAKSEINNTHMLQSLLYQLLSQEKRLYPAYRKKYRSLRDHSQNRVIWTFDDLYEVFISMVEFNDFPLTIYLIIDAMDESEHSERSRILSLLQHFCQNDSACVIKCVLASRPHEDIKDHFLVTWKSRNFSHLLLEKKNEEDIKEFIEIAMSKVQDAYLAQRPEPTVEFKDMITYATDKLEKNARGVFMWVEIVTRELERVIRQGVSPKDFKEKVDKLPNELEPFYEHIVQDLMARFEKEAQKRPKDKEKENPGLREAQRMLTWVTFAERPLSVEEFRDAVAIPDVVGENSGINLKDYRLLDDIAVRQRMSFICGDLLEIGSSQDSADFSLFRDTHDIVQLLHLTVRDFLIGDPRAAKFLMEKYRGGHDIFLNCVSYLRLFVENCPKMNNMDNRDYKPIIRHLTEWPLLSYILRFFPRHRAESNHHNKVFDDGAKFADFVMSQKDSSAFFILESWFGKVGLTVPSHSSLEQATDFRFDCINLAVAEGYLNVVAVFLEAETVAAADIRYRHLLYNASRRGILSLTRFLLLLGVDAGSTGEDGNTALQAASVHGHRDIVKLLLKYGADAKAQGVNGSVLNDAIKSGSMDVIKLLLRFGADANAQGVNGSVLNDAIKSGSMDVVELLLHFGADANAQGVNGSVLNDAIKSGSMDIIKLLLYHRADANAQGRNGSALDAAIESGSKDIVELLLRSGADPNAQGVNGSALDAAKKKCSKEIIELLHDYGAVPNVRD